MPVDLDKLHVSTKQQEFRISKKVGKSRTKTNQMHRQKQAWYEYTQNTKPRYKMKKRI